MGRRKEELAAAAAAEHAEDKFEAALRLFVAHCGGDLGNATTQQREAFDAELSEISAHVAALVLEAEADS